MDVAWRIVAGSRYLARGSGQRATLIAKIEADPAEKLSRAEIIALAVRGTMQ